MANKTKSISIEPYTYRKDGKRISVKGHKREISVETVPVTKKQYEAAAKKRSKASLERDKSRTMRNSVYGSRADLPKSWNTKNTDWVGVDAKGYTYVPKDHSVLQGGYDGYRILKWIKNKRPKYQPQFRGKPIGATTPYTSLQAAKNACKTHHGRRTGKIKNKSIEAVQHKILQTAKNPYRLRDDPNFDYDSFDDSADYHDSSLSQHENYGLQRSRFSFREQSINWR